MSQTAVSLLGELKFLIICFVFWCILFLRKCVSCINWLPSFLKFKSSLNFCSPAKQVNKMNKLKKLWLFQISMTGRCVNNKQRSFRTVFNYLLRWLKHTSANHKQLIDTYKIAISSRIWNVERNPRIEACFHVGLLLWRSNNKPVLTPLKSVATVMFIYGDKLSWNLKKTKIKSNNDFAMNVA